MNANLLSVIYEETIRIQGSKHYKQEVELFFEKLKGYLKSHLGNDILFLDDMAVNCIHANYKGNDITIDLSNGISLTVANIKNASWENYFENLFTKIAGKNMTCCYDYISENNKIQSQTFEWSLQPKERLYSLRKNENIQNLNDRYTPEVIQNLSTIYKNVEMIQDSNITLENHKDIVELFINELNTCFYIYFGNNVKFYPGDSINQIYVSFKGSIIVMDITNGISLTATDDKSASQLKNLQELFTKIVGKNITCSYDYKYDNSDTSYSTIEWSTHPVERMNELRQNVNVQNLNDTYTPDTINELGHQLLTLDGYIRLFGDNDNEFGDETYKIIIIQKIYPSLGTSMLLSWITSCRAQLCLTKKIG